MKIYKEIFLILICFFATSFANVNLSLAASTESTISTSTLTEANVQAMIKEVKNYKKNNSDANPWVNEIVAKYISVGSKKAEILPILEKSGFVIGDVNKKDFNSKKFDEVSLADTKFWIFPNFFRHTFRIYLNFKDENLVEVKGRVILNSL